MSGKNTLIVPKKNQLADIFNPSSGNISNGYTMSNTVNNLYGQTNMPQPQPDFYNQNSSIMARIEALKNVPTYTWGQNLLERKTSELGVKEALFDACANVKIITSQISMHLQKGWREKLFYQIDLIHDSEGWDDDDNIINLESFKVFLSWITQIEFMRGPGIGLSPEGFLIAAWTNEKNRLTLEFFPDKKVHWISTISVDDELERSAGLTTISRLNTVLSPYNPRLNFYNKD